MPPYTIFVIYEQAINNFSQKLAYLEWRITSCLSNKSSMVFDLLKQMEGTPFLCATSGLCRELIAASYLIIQEDYLFIASSTEFVKDISTYVELTDKDVFIVGNDPTEFCKEILIPYLESFSFAYQMTSKLLRFIVTRSLTFQMTPKSTIFSLTQFKDNEKYALMKTLTLTNYLVPTLRKIQDLLQVSDVRLASALLREAITGFINQHTHILRGKIRAIPINNAYREIIEEYPLMNGEDVFFDASWRLVLGNIWSILVDYLSR